MGVAEPVIFNPFEAGFHEDPYRQYALLRTHDPVHETAFGPFVLTRYRDVFAVLRDASLSVEDRNLVMQQREAVAAVLAEDPDRAERNRGSRAMLNLDPPDHTRIRGLVAKVFTPRRIERLRAHVQALVDEALDRVAPTGEMDVIDDLAFPLPFTVISEMLGMPEANRDQVRTWSGDLVKILDPVLDADDVRRAFAASDQLDELLADVLAWKRQHPADDLLSALLAVEDGADVLSPEELRDQVVLLYLAGHETTVNLIGNGVLALLRHPEQLARLQADPSLDGPAVDELLRYDCPVQNSRRITRRDLVIDGTTIPAGTMVLTILGSANRDPEQWGPTADQLDLSRSGAGQHVAFGSGTHYCLGASLARLEGQVAIGSLVRRLPDLHLTDEPLAYNGRLTLRGLEHLPLRFTPG